MSCGAFHIAEEVHCTIQSTAEPFDIKSFIFKNLHLKKASLASRIFFLPIIDLFVIFSYLDFSLFPSLSNYGLIMSGNITSENGLTRTGTICNIVI